MTAQVNALAAPQLKEAEDGVVYVGKLKEHATALVHPYTNQAEGDVVALSVETSTGNSFEVDTVVTSAGVGKPLTLAIPKDIFEKNLVPGASAKLHYVKKGEISEHSDTLQVTLEL